MNTTKNTKKSRFFLKTILTFCVSVLAFGSAEAAPAGGSSQGKSEAGVQKEPPKASDPRAFMSGPPQRARRRAWESDDPAAEALLKAAYEGDLEGLKAALAKGTPVNVKNFAGEHGALAMAAMSNPSRNLEVAKALIAAGADVNISDSKGRTPLMELSRFDEGAEMAKLLIDAGADVNARMVDGTTAIERTCMRGRASKILNMLIAAKADVNAQDGAIGFSPLHYAVLNGHAEQIQALIAAGANVNIGMQPPNRDGIGENAPCFNGMTGNIICAGTTPLMLAADNSRKPTAEMMEVIKMLISAKADVNRADDNGWTPLLVALARKKPELVTLFLMTGANPNTANKHGTSPLMMASAVGMMDMVKLLIGAGADVNAKDIEGKTALDLAATDDIKKILREATGKGKKK